MKPSIIFLVLFFLLCLMLAFFPVANTWLPYIIIIILAFCIAAAIIFYYDNKKRNQSIQRLVQTLQDFRIHQKSPDINVGDDAVSELENEISSLCRQLVLQQEKTQTEQEKMLDFTSDISHQLKTPLASIKLYSEMMLEEAGDPRVLKQIVLVERMEELIGSLLKAERLRLGRIPMKFESCDMTMLVKQIFADMKISYPHKAMDLTAPEKMLLRCDPHWLQEALLNIIKNSAIHTPPQGSIRVELSEGEHFNIIKISDNGGGVSAADLPYLFERYYQAKTKAPETSGSSNKGTGLGLPIAKAIILKHHGSIQARNDTRGLSIIIQLPILEANLTKS